NDQRGAGFARTKGPAPDIGAFEATSSDLPIATITPPADVTTSGGMSYILTVAYADATAINVSSLGDTDIHVTGPGGFDTFAKFQGVDVNSNGSPRVATYSLTPPGGSWDSADDGNYTVNMEPNQVADSDGNPVPAGTLASIRVLIPRTLVVNATNDEATDTDG